jgi:hypothetical protein
VILVVTALSSICFGCFGCFDRYKKHAKDQRSFEAWKAAIVSVLDLIMQKVAMMRIIKYKWHEAGLLLGREANDESLVDGPDHVEGYAVRVVHDDGRRIDGAGRHVRR